MSTDIQQSTVLKVLRAVGALILLGSAGTVLLRDWEALSGTSAYLGLLATTFLLAVAGIACSLILKEAKGARTFLALSLFTVPVSFAALGGLLYATKVDSAAVAPSLAILAASALILVPAAFVGFLALARAHARSLTIALLLSSSLLLLPIRDTAFATIAVLVVPIGLAFYQLFRLRSSTAMRTWEGWLARAVLYLPLAILAARTCIYWELTAFFLAAHLASLSGILWLISAHTQNHYTRHALRVISVPPLVLAALAMMLDLPLASQWSITVGTLCLVAALVAMAALSPRQHKGYLTVASVAAFVGMLSAYLGAPSLLIAMVSMIVGISFVVVGYGARNAVAFVTGLALTFLITCAHLVHVIDRIPQDWVAFAVIGALVIVIASIIERFGSRVTRRYVQLRARFVEPGQPQSRFAEPPESPLRVSETNSLHTVHSVLVDPAE